MSQRTSSRTSRDHHTPRRLRGVARPAQMALLAMGGVLLVYAQAVAALGVGEPRYLSHLFEPLQVDIPVDTRGVDPAAVKVGVSLSGADPASLAAISGQIKREWRSDERGGHVLRVTAPQAVHEPMLQMRVEVGDDRIQAVRDLTLMFDPAPVAIAREAEPAVAPVASLEPAAAPVVAAVAETPVLARAEAEAVAEVESESEVEGAADGVDAAAVLRAIEAELEAEASVVAVSDAGEPAVVRPDPVAPLTLVAVPATPVTRLKAAQPVIAAPAARAEAAQPVLARADTPIEKPAAPAATPIAATIAPRDDAAPVEPVLAAAAPALGEAERAALIASTLEPRALSAIDRWQRVRVVEGDTLDSLAAKVRGGHDEIPLPLVAMLLRWLNPRSFEQSVGMPLPGAELRFPNPESLAAQIAVSGGVWTVDDVTAASANDAAAVPPPSFQLLTAQSAASLNQTLQAATAAGTERPEDAAAAIAALGAGMAIGGTPKAPAVRLSGALVGGSALAGVLSMLLMLNMVLRTPQPQGARELAGAVVARALVPAQAAATESRVLPGEAFDLASLDLGPSADPLRVRSPAAGERTNS